MPKLFFNKDGYREVLEVALRNGYAFRLFDDLKDRGSDSLCLLRHDVDADLSAAATLARIDADLGIQATFFLMLRSPIYNLLSRANHAFVRSIISMGHSIGLHYDEGFWPGDQHTLQEWIDLEAGILEDLFDTTVAAVSFHQPGPRVLANEFKLANRINTYDPVDMDGFHYISDSSKIWKEEDILHIFSENLYPRLQLLIHPMWWARDSDEPAPVIWERTLVESFQRAQDQILATERAYGGRRDFLIRTST